MIAWGAVLACSGFHYSGVEKSMRFTSNNGTYFWSNGYQYGRVKIMGDNKNKIASLTVLKGNLTLKSFTLNGFGEVKFKKGKTFNQDEIITMEINRN